MMRLIPCRFQNVNSIKTKFRVKAHILLANSTLLPKCNVRYTGYF